jgi:dephospho-CoA kinase
VHDARRKPIIGLTGGVGAGKSTVARMLAELGCLVTDSDALARAVLERADVKAALVSWWGDRILNDAGEVDRRAVASIVFGDARERRRLEELTHPLIEQQRKMLWAKAPPTTTAFVIDAPLLIEAGLHRECDAVIFVDAPRDVRLQRLRETRGWDEAELARRENSQLPLDVKRQAAHHVVQNTGDLHQLRSQVEHVFQLIVAGLGH